MNQEKFTAFSILTVLVVTLAGFLFGYSTAIISGVIIFLSDYFSLTSAQQGFAVSVHLIGGTIAIGFTGLLADTFGRKKMISLIAIIFTLSILLTAVSHTMIVFLVGRFFTGIAMGMSLNLIPIYLAEISPARHRGAFVSFYQFSVTFGILIAYIVNYFLSQDGNWRWMIGLSLIPALLFLLGMVLIHESPSWSLAHGYHDKAIKFFELMRKDRHWETTVAKAKDSPHLKNFGWEGVFKPSIRPMLFIAISLSIFVPITGINSIIFYTPKILQSITVTSASMAILPTVGIGIVNLLSTALSVWLLDQSGRRKLLLTGLAGMFLSISLLSYLLFVKPENLYVWILLSAASYVIFFAFSLGAVTPVVNSEIFPLHVRGKALSLASMSNLFCSYFVTLSFLPLVNTIGLSYTFNLFAITTAVAFFFVYRYLPETKGKSLEEIEQMFLENKKK